MPTPRKPFTPAIPAKPAAAPTAAAPAFQATPAPAIAERSEIKGSGKPKAPGRAPTHDEIKNRAFEIYASRGYAAGDPTADWLEAERQLKAGL